MLLSWVTELLWYLHIKMDQIKKTDQSFISLLKLSIEVSQSVNRFESTMFPSSEGVGEKVSDKMGAPWTLS